MTDLDLHIADILKGRADIFVVALQLIGDGPRIIGVRDVLPPVRVRREELDIRAGGSRFHDSPLRYGGTQVRLATSAERAAQRAAERSQGRYPRPIHLWGGRWVSPAPCTPAEIQQVAQAHQDRAVLVARACRSFRESSLTPEERRTERDAARPRRNRAARRRGAKS